MIKILFITHFDLSGHSGSEVATRSVVRALSRRQDVALTLLSPAPADGSDLASGLEITTWSRLPARTRPSPWWHLATALRVRRRCRGLLEQLNPDVVVVRYGPFFVPSAFLFPRRNCRLVLLIRGRMPLNIAGVPGRLIETFIRRISLAVAARADRLLFAFRDAVKDFGRRLPSDRVQIVPNAADITAFPEISRAEARRALRNENDCLVEGRVVGFAGSLRSRHCLEELLQGSSRLHRRGVAHQLIIVGDGPVRRDLEHKARELRIQDSVHFIGQVQHDRVGLYLAACDLLYAVVDPEQPSNPIKVYEALASGRPVVTSPRPELLFVDDQELGVMVTGQDAQAIATALERGLSLDWTDRDAARARSYVAKHHTWDTVAAEILRCESRRRYSETIENTPHGKVTAV